MKRFVIHHQELYLTLFNCLLWQISSYTITNIIAIKHFILLVLLLLCTEYGVVICNRFQLILMLWQIFDLYLTL